MLQLNPIKVIKDNEEYTISLKIGSHPIKVVNDDADDIIGLEIGDAVEIDGEIYFYNGHYDYVYSEVAFKYCFVKNKNNINTPEERREMYQPNNDLVIDSRDLNDEEFSSEGSLCVTYFKKES